MRFGHVELGVHEPRASRDFYVDRLGFTLVADQGAGFQWVERGGVEILLRKGAPSPGVCLVFYTDDPDAEAARLGEAGADVAREGSCWVLSDPDGHRIEVVNPGDDHSGD